MGKEIELKYLLKSSEQIDELLSHPIILEQIAGPLRVINMDSIYYDTSDGALSMARISLRRRRENSDTVFTVKTPKVSDGAFSARGEWQVNARSLDDALPLLKQAGAPQDLFDILENRQLVPRARTTFVRKTVPLKLGAELCLDSGFLGVDAFAEMELELTHGNVEELQAFGEKCRSAFSLTPESRSKYHRAKLSLVAKKQ